MSNSEKPSVFEQFEGKGQARSEQRGIQQAAQEGYASGAHFQRGSLLNDHHAINQQFGNLQIVDHGKVVASSQARQEAQPHYPNTGGFGAWHREHRPENQQIPRPQQQQHEQQQERPHTNFGGWRDNGMQMPSADNQSLAHTVGRTLNNNWGHQSYVRKSY
jgi:hypothetical protein